MPEPQTPTESEETEAVKEVIEFKQTSDGKTIKIVKKVKIYKKKVLLNKRVEDRQVAADPAHHIQKWRKFGACAGLPAGLEPGVSYFGDEVILVPVRKREGDDAEGGVDAALAAGKQVESGITCRNCGAVGDHWTTKCPLKGKAPPPQDLSHLDRDDAPRGGAPGKYVPPSRREGGGGGGGGRFDDRERDEASTVRVTNLSEDTLDQNLDNPQPPALLTRQDLHDLFKPFGAIQRVFVAKDRETGMAKGFAFVTFFRRPDAARAIEKLHRVPYRHLILNLEWAKPSNK